MTTKDKTLTTEEKIYYKTIDMLCNDNYVGGFMAVEIAEKVKNIVAEALQQERKEQTTKIINLIEIYIPTDDMGSYGGEGAMSNNQVAEMFVDDLIPAVEKLLEDK